jgi:2-hydroxychromene-2-carboxylate isomerase
MTSRRPPSPRIYFNLRSPYSWLAVHDLVTRYPQVAEGIRWRPFWEPDERSERLLRQAGGRFIYTPMSREKHLYILGDVRRLAQRRGLEIRWPIDREPHWEVAHLAFFEANRQGLGREFVLAVSRARWQEGADISDPDQVGRIGAGLGLDADRLAAAHRDPGLMAEGTGALLDLCRDSVFGVPYFVYGRECFWGVDRLTDFVALVQGTGLDSVPEVPPVISPLAVPAPGGELGHAGGCG